MPKISVIIPTYNRANYICDTIDSVINQTDQDYEIIVIDDGSTDDTKNRITKYGSKIRYFYQNNMGPSSARNYGIKIAAGKYISLIDSDDICFPQKLEIQSAFLDNNPEIDLVCSWYEHIDENGNALAQKTAMPCARDITLEGMLIGRVGFNFSSFLYRKSCFSTGIYFDNDIKGAEDWDLWLRLAITGCRFSCITTPLVKYRIHRDGLYSNDDVMFENSLKMFNKLFRLNPIDDKLSKHAYYNLYYEFSWRFHYKGREDRARFCMKKAIELFPEKMLKKATFIEWAYYSIPSQMRRHEEIYKSLDNIEAGIMEKIEHIFTPKESISLPAHFRKRSYANAHLSLSELYYYSRNMKKARVHFVKAFMFSPLLSMNINSLLIFIKSFLGADFVHKMSLYKSRLSKKFTDIRKVSPL